MRTGIAPHLDSAVHEEVGYLRSDNDDLRGTVRALKGQLDEVSSAQQATNGQDIDRGESSVAGDVPRVPAAEYLGGGGGGVLQA